MTGNRKNMRTLENDIVEATIERYKAMRQYQNKSGIFFSEDMVKACEEYLIRLKSIRHAKGL